MRCSIEKSEWSIQGVGCNLDFGAEVFGNRNVDKMSGQSNNQ